MSNLATLAIFILICSLTILFVVLNAYKNERQIKKRAILILTELGVMINCCQRHRGLCAAYLKGNTSSIDEIKALSKAIKHQISLINTHKLLANNGRWLSISDHWSRLSTNATTLSSQHSFEQHTGLIENQLFLMEDIAQEYNFSRAYYAEFPNINYVWSELPKVIERIGQSRAIGVGIVSSKQCTKVDKVKLGYLHQRISETTKAVLQTFQVADSHQKSVSKAFNDCTNLLNIIDKEILNADEMSLEPEYYFDSASQAMEAINEVLNFEIKAFLSAHMK
ncbi:nitrate- and nitrite sensing domain-containing protein [Glaciecola sp. KUL10]|uniref:nitrate- and nitrite sensing domain-containing protein n=1 Tax=Glaciecola sp. (strain KUL10) TaxID=2161813 RepID=UPI000D786D88|nr:nitrate- and nitrite sensing domain-containing protein [Glaciecola sp. KUL10]GBL04083.1 hypothetical protein KUL10_13880 [Glaciecola sp. KUL10]